MTSYEKPLSPSVPPSPLKGEEGVVTNNLKVTSGLTLMMDAGGKLASHDAGEAPALFGGLMLIKTTCCFTPACHRGR